MQDQMELQRNEQREGDDKGHGMAATALMGAAAGAVGTFCLDRADWTMWNHEDEEAKARTIRVRPHGEPPAHVAAGKVEKALGVEPTPKQHEMAGFVTHYGIGIGPAMIYALVRDKLPGRGVARGLLYGFGVFVVQDEILNSASGLGAKPRDYPWQAHARGLVSHLVYGVATELALNLMEKAVKGRRQEPAPG